MDKNSEIDNTDIKILSALMKDAKTPYTEIADYACVSGGTVHVRMKKMERLGIVTGSTLSIDFKKLGYDITAFLGIYLLKNSLYEEVSKQLAEIPEVLTLHYTTGQYNIFASIICRDTQHLRTVLHDKIQKITGITRTETFISLEERINKQLKLDTVED
ncbi:MAG: Lrp/AsnC family transcriptional regulator for asnA, asnC and gidA [Arenicella sp.]|jgi:Lrp/AsnC family transcriptional regulator for asnA, asnC and gidA